MTTTTTTKRLLFITALFYYSFIFSQEIVTDRPDQTESSVTVGKNNFQIESGVLFEKSNDNSVNRFFGPSTLLRYGISKGIELRFVSQYESTKIEFEGGEIDYLGFNDLEIGVKFQVFKKEKVNTEIAFLSHVIIPTANKNLTNEKIGVINKLAISHTISKKIGLGYNLGYDYISKQSSLTYSLALGISLSDKLSFYAEPYGAWGESNTFESNFDTGLTFLVNSNFQLDASFGTGLNNDMQYVSTGFSWRIANIFNINKS
tara:strand:- start:15698 stop:16477 length:780 start_codon:yes stop_codon:yes gene_type:complete